MTRVTIGIRTFGIEFIFNDLPIPADGLLGNDFLLGREAVLSYQNQDTK
jgi:hypothetical protein